MNLIKNASIYIKVLLKWIFAGIIVGAIGGVVGSIFHESIELVTNIREENRFLIFLLPLGGLIIAFLYGLFKAQGKMDSNRVIESAGRDESVPLVMSPLIFISTVITHLFGGSAGREGAAIQLGGSIGYNIGKVLRLNKNDLHVIVTSGMSAVFAALFGTPLTATFFALEVVNVGVMHYMAFVPSIISSITAYKIALACGVSPVKFNFINIPELSIDVVIKALIMAILCAFVSILFCLAIKKCEDIMERKLPNKYIRTFLGGLAIALLTVAVGTHDYNGAGMSVIERAMGGEARPEAFILKILFTAITISAGFRGGEIVPTLFIGSTFGCVLGTFLGLDGGFAAAIGFVALFCGVVNCPVASIMLALEVFGADGILIFAMVCGVSYLMSGNFGLYKSQRIIYSKLDEQYVDINAK